MQCSVGLLACGIAMVGTAGSRGCCLACKDRVEKETMLELVSRASMHVGVVLCRG